MNTLSGHGRNYISERFFSWRPILSRAILGVQTVQHPEGQETEKAPRVESCMQISFISLHPSHSFRPVYILQGTTRQMFPRTQICLVKHSSTHTYCSRSKSSTAVFCNLTFKLKNSPTWAELLLHPGFFLRCQAGSSKLAIRGPELGPLF